MTMPKKYGALYKYEIKLITNADDKVFFKSDFINEDFIFDLKGQCPEFVDVYEHKQLMKKQTALPS
ncbi:hypothetical protein NX021_14095 [Cytobacillus firmus]|nr:hypothetical protein [Cytobacillus firmus]